MNERPPAVLFETARQQAGFSVMELWLAYFALGGLATSSDIGAILAGRAQPDRHDHDLLAVALNERFLDMRLNHPIPYLSDVGG